MVAFNKLVEGQILYDRHRYKTYGGSQMGEWLVKVVTIDTEKRMALCSWNTNPPRWYSEKQLLKLHVNRKE